MIISYMYNFSFVFRYAMRLRFVREYMNKKTLKILDKSTKISPEKLEKLKNKSAQKVSDFPVILK